MEVTVKINTDNAAFEDAAGQELARILRKLADQVSDWLGANPFQLSVRDVNGNRCGELKVTR